MCQVELKREREREREREPIALSNDSWDASHTRGAREQFTWGEVLCDFEAKVKQKMPLHSRVRREKESEARK